MIKFSIIEQEYSPIHSSKLQKESLLKYSFSFEPAFLKSPKSSQSGLSREIGTATLKHEYFLLQTTLLAALKNVWDHYPAETPNAKAFLPQRMAALLTPKYPYIENGS